MRGLADGSILIKGCLHEQTLCRMLTDGSLSLYGETSGLLDVSDDGSVTQFVDGLLTLRKPARDVQAVWRTCPALPGAPQVSQIAVDRAAQIYVALSWADGRPQEIRMVKQTKDPQLVHCPGYGALTTLETQTAARPLVARLVPGQTLLSIGVGPNARLYYLIAENGSVSLIRSNGASTTTAIASANLENATKLFNPFTGKVDLYDRYGQYFASQHPLTHGLTAGVSRETTGWPNQYLDAYGNATQLSYTSDGLLYRVVGPYGQTTQLSYDSKNRLSTVTAPGGAVWTMTYHGSTTLLKTFKKPTGTTSEHTYDENRRVTSSHPGMGGTYLVGRSAVASEGGGGQGVAFTDGDNVTSRVSIARAADGAVSRSRTQGGRTMVMTTNDARTHETVRTPAGTRESRAHMPDPQLLMTRPMVTSTRTYPSGRQATSSEQRAQLGAVDSYQVTRNGRTTKVDFDKNTRTLTVRKPSGRRAYVVLNEVGNPASRTNFKGVSTYFSRDEHGRIQSIERDGQVRTFEYGTDGLLSAKYGPKADEAVYYGRNALGQVTSVKTADQKTTTFTYENFRLAEITPPEQPPHELSWSPLGDFGGYQPPNGIADTIAQTLGGRPGVTTRASGRWVEPKYVDGILESLDSSDGSTLFHYDGNGQLSSATTPGGLALGFTYDGELPLSNTFNWADLPNDTSLNRDYDAALQLSTEHLNGSLLASYGYDQDGLLNQAGAATLVRDAQTGNLSSASVAGVTTGYGYDYLQRPLSRTTQRGANVIFDEQLSERDEAGRITTRSETVRGQSHMYQYVYDQQGRLVRTLRDERTLHTYRYDANGNLLQATDWGTMQDTSSCGCEGLPGCDCNNEGGSTTNVRLGARDASYDAQDRLIAVQITKRVTTPDGPEDATTSRAHSYDSDGYVDTWTDQNDGATTDLDYDVLGNLKQVSLPSGAVVSYESDAMQRRVVRRVDGEVTVRWVYRDSLHPAAELDEAGNLVSTFIYAEEPNTPRAWCETARPIGL